MLKKKVVECLLMKEQTKNKTLLIAKNIIYWKYGEKWSNN